MYIIATTTTVEQWVWGMRPEAWLTVAAIFLGPVVALGIQRWLDKKREARGRRMWVFRELMVTRGARLSSRHVEAFNTIWLEFKAERKVMEAWDKYFELFINANPDSTNESQMKSWLEKGDELLAQLLYQIADILGYEIGEIDLRKKFYVPRAHGDAELEGNVIRRGLAEVMVGNKRIPMDVDFAEEFKDFLANAAKQAEVAKSQPRQAVPEAVVGGNSAPTKPTAD